MTLLPLMAAAAQFMAYAVPAAAVATIRPVSIIGALAYDFVGDAVTTDFTGRSYEQVLIKGRVVTFGDKARIDIEEAGWANGSMRGSYMLLSEAGTRVLWVNPLLRQYRETDLESMFSGLNDLYSGSSGLIAMQASNAHVETQRVGAGPVIQGHTTLHYRLLQHMDMKTKVLYRTSTTHDEQIIDYYYATDLPRFNNPFLPAAPSLPQGGTLLGEDYTKQLRTAIDKLYQGGAALRTIVSAKSTDAVGHIQSSVVTTEVMNVRHSDVSAAMFDVPAGYTKMANQLSSSVGAPDDAALFPSVSPFAAPALGDTQFLADNVAAFALTRSVADPLGYALSH